MFCAPRNLCSLQWSPSICSAFCVARQHVCLPSEALLSSLVNGTIDDMDVQFDRCNVLDALLQYAGLQHLHYGPGDFPLSTALDLEHILATRNSDPYTTPTTSTSSILDMLVSLGHQGHAGHGSQWLRARASTARPRIRGLSGHAGHAGHRLLSVARRVFLFPAISIHGLMPWSP